MVGFVVNDSVVCFGCSFVGLYFLGLICSFVLVMDIFNSGFVVYVMLEELVVDKMFLLVEVICIVIEIFILFVVWIVVFIKWCLGIFFSIVYVDGMVGLD